MRIKKSICNRIEKVSRETNDRQKFDREFHEARKEAIDRWWHREGAAFFLRFIEEQYFTHQGLRINFNEPFFKEFLQLIGNPWLLWVVVSKGAQMGYTEVSVALCAFSVAIVRGSAIFCVSEKLKLTDIVAPRFQPALNAIPVVRELRQKSKDLRGKADTDTQQRTIEVGGSPVFFAYAGRAGKRPGERQVSSSLSSVPVEVTIVADEAEDMPPGALDILWERTSASNFPTSIMRCGSTPGAEGGVMDVETRSSKYWFDWEVRCPHCDREQILEVFGNLIKSIPREKRQGQHEFLNLLGAPLDWFCHEGVPPLYKDDRTPTEEMERAIDTAYVGCKYCSGEITREAIARGRYRCRHSGKLLSEFSEEVFRSQKPFKDKVAIQMPRLASVRFEAPHRMRRLIETRNKPDAFQQGFGLVISLGGGFLDRPALLSAIGRPLPAAFNSDEPDLVVVGVDQGQAVNFCSVQHWFFEPRWLNEKVDPISRDRLPCLNDVDEVDAVKVQLHGTYAERQWSSGFKKIVAAKEVGGGMEGVVEIAREYGADIVAIDLHPEAGAASRLCSRYRFDRESSVRGKVVNILELCRSRFGRRSYFEGSEKTKADYFEDCGMVLLFKQSSLAGGDLKLSSVNVQGNEIQIFSIDRTSFLDALRDRIYEQKQSFPPDFSRDLANKNTVLYHYTTSERLPDAKWQEKQGEPDHFFHADNFGEAGASCWRFLPKPRTFSFGTL